MIALKSRSCSDPHPIKGAPTDTKALHSVVYFPFPLYIYCFPVGFGSRVGPAQPLTTVPALPQYALGILWSAFTVR